MVVLTILNHFGPVRFPTVPRPLLIWVGFRWVVGGGAVVLWNNQEKWEVGGEGGGWGRDRQRSRQVNAQALSKLPFSNLPFSFSMLPARSSNARNCLLIGCLLRWAKSRDSYCRIASESYRCDKVRFESLAFVGGQISPPPPKKRN